MPLPDIYATRKQGQKLLHELEVKHNFNILENLIELFKGQKEIYEIMMIRLTEALSRREPLDVAFGEADRKILKDALGTQEGILRGLLGYAYPKMKTQEIKVDDTRKITWEINVPPVPLPGANPVVIDVTQPKLLGDAKPAKKQRAKPKKEKASVSK